MKLGTRSLLFGVHAVWWHFLTVLVAWRRLYGSWPNWWQSISIFCHDLGYWGKPNMDGEEGRDHPVRGAQLAAEFACVVWCLVNPRGTMNEHADFYSKVYDFTLCHSRELSKRLNVEPSKLCWADKYCVVIEPRWFYLLRARLSGELDEYLDNAKPITEDLLMIRYMHTWKETKRGQRTAEEFWLDWYREKVCNLPEIKKLVVK